MIYDRNMNERFTCFNVNFRLLKITYVHLFVCYLNKLQNARCNDKENHNLIMRVGKSKGQTLDAQFNNIQTSLHTEDLFKKKD